MTEQIGWRGFIKTMKTEAPNYAMLLPQLPRLLHNYLAEGPENKREEMLRKIIKQQQRNNSFLSLIGLTLLCLVAWEALRYYAH